MVSIIVPVFNTGLYLNKCIESIVNQSFTDWECILVDDGSTDGSGSICDDWSNRNSKIVVVHQNNTGVSSARNHGLQLARGEYIAFIDSDDWVEKDYLLFLYNSIVYTGADMAVCGMELDFIDGRYEIYSPNVEDTFDLSTENTEKFVALNEKSLLYGPVVKLYKNHIIKNNNIRFDYRCSYGEDLYFNYQYLDYVKKIVTIPIVQYHYRISNTNSLSNRFRPEKFDIDYKQWQVLKDFYMSKEMWNEASKKLLYRRLWGCLYDSIFLYPKLRDRSLSYLRRVLSIPEIDELESYYALFQSSRWIKEAILKRRAIIFYIYFICMMR